MRILVALVAILIVHPFSLWAQGLSGQTCIDLASTVASGLTTNLSLREMNALRHYANCNSSQSTGSAGLNVAYESFGLGARYDETRKKSECTKDDRTLGFTSVDLRNAKVVFEQGLATVNLCLEKAARSWSIVARQTSPDSVSFSLSNLSSSGADLAGIDIIPEGALKCVGAPQTFPLRVTSTNYVSMTCQREVVRNAVEGITISTAQDVTLVLRLADGPFPISLKGYSTSPFDALRREVATLRSDLDAYIKQTNDVLYGGSEVPIENGTCPPGTYASGVRSHSVSGGAHGYLESAWAVCKSLRFERPK